MLKAVLECRLDAQLTEHVGYERADTEHRSIRTPANGDAIIVKTRAAAVRAMRRISPVAIGMAHIKHGPGIWVPTTDA